MSGDIGYTAEKIDRIFSERRKDWANEIAVSRPEVHAEIIEFLTVRVPEVDIRA